MGDWNTRPSPGLRTMVLRLWLESVQEAVLKVCLLNTSLSRAGLDGRDGREDEGKLMARMEETAMTSNKVTLSMMDVLVVLEYWNHQQTVSSVITTGTLHTAREIRMDGFSQLATGDNSAMRR